METVDYKQMYSEIPYPYKQDVMKEAGCYKPDIHNWKKGERGKVGIDKLQRLETAIDKHYRIHSLAKTIKATMRKRIKVNIRHKLIDYSDLMSFKVDISGTIGDHETKFQAVSLAHEEINRLNNKNPYSIKLLIAKYIIHDQRNDN